MREQLPSPKPRRQLEHNQEGRESPSRVVRFFRKFLFFSSGYQVLKQAYLSGNEQIAADIAEFFEPEIRELWTKTSRGSEQPPTLRAKNRADLEYRLNQVDALLAKAGIDHRDRRSVVRLALKEFENDPQHHQGSGSSPQIL